MPRLSNNYQISTLCCNTPYAICSQRQSDLAAKEASPYWCRVANNNHDCLLDEDWSKTVALSHASGVAAKFPEKVHHMLDDISKRGDESIVSWQPHGRAFRVHNKQRFVETVLPKFFGHSNYTSFTRQLNLYCFHRIKAGRDKGAYYHELFLHSEPYRCREIVRQRVKGNWGKKKIDVPSMSSTLQDGFFSTSLWCAILSRGDGKLCRLLIGSKMLRSDGVKKL